MIKQLLFSLLLTSNFLSWGSPFSGELKRKEVEKVCHAVAEWQIANHDKVKHDQLDWTNGTLNCGVGKNLRQLVLL